MKAKMIRLLVAIALVVSLAAAIMPASPVMAATPIYVNSATGNDGWDGEAPAWDGTHGPKATIGQGVLGVDVGGTVIVAAGTYNEWGIDILNDVTIQGAGAGVTIVDGQGNDGVFDIDGPTVNMSGLTIQNGDDDDGGGFYVEDDATLIMTNCVVRDNTAYTGGGIFLEESDLTMTDCTISGNRADSSPWLGGGIYSQGLSADFNVVTLNNCTISGNWATWAGGGIYNEDYSDLTMVNCTVSGNSAVASGGGIDNDGELELINCTVTDNGDAGTSFGGGIDNFTGDSCTLTCTIVWGNTATSNPEIRGAYDANEAIIGGITITDPLLGPLQDNGGPTETHAIGEGGSAIDGCSSNCTVATDQRGVARPQGDHCDIGAYEAESDQPPSPTQPPSIPALSLWGTTGLAVVLAGFLAWSVRRRLAGSGIR